MTILDPPTNNLNMTTNLSSSNQATNITDQAFSGLSSIGNTFSEFFSEALQTDEPVQQSSTNTANTGDSVDSMQQSLLSSLGLASLSSVAGENALAQLTSQSSIDAMQSTVLSAIQNKLFSAQTSPSESITSSTISSTTNNDDSIVEDNMIEDGIIESYFLDVTAITTDMEELSFGENGFNIEDVFDVFNVLQHVPVVSGIYQEVTEQDISPVSKLVGGFLYGGMFGVAFSALDLAIESYSGASINDQLVSFDYKSMFTSNSSNEVAEELIEIEQSTANYFSRAGQIADNNTN